MCLYEEVWIGEKKNQEAVICSSTKWPTLRHPQFRGSCAVPHCGAMVAPVSSEFVEGGEIRHHWECEACGEFSSTSIPLTSH
jgi:hypothetical protein